jgi:hypothetical protein
MMHTFWEAKLTDQKGREIPHTIMVHAVGLPYDEEAIIDHLRRHNFPRAKDIKIKPAEGLINFHGYPVKALSQPMNPGYNAQGQKVNMSNGELLGPDGQPIKVDDNDLIVEVQHPNPPKDSKAVSPSKPPSDIIQGLKVTPR